MFNFSLWRLTVSTIIVSFPILRTRTGSFIFSFRIPGRNICSRKYGLGFRENREVKPMFLSVCLSVFLSIFCMIDCSSVRPSVRPSYRLSLFLSFLSSFYLFFFFFFILFFSSRISCLNGKFGIIFSSRNPRRDRELLQVPENEHREGFGNCFHENFGNFRDITGKLWCLVDSILLYVRKINKF